MAAFALVLCATAAVPTFGIRAFLQWRAPVRPAWFVLRIASRELADPLR